MTGFWLKVLLAGIGMGAIAYFLACLALLLWQNRLIFAPCRRIEQTPADLGLAYEDVWLPVLSWEGKLERLHGWWIAATPPSGHVLLYLHGNGGNISANLGRAQRFRKMGFSVLAIDYRGYGRSEGKFPTEAEVYRDAQAAWEYLVGRRGVKPQDIFIYGHSLGGAIAIDLAVRKPRSAGLIVESSFTAMRDMADGRGIYPFFPIDSILTQRFDSRSKLRLLQIPLLLIHGREDSTVPARMSQVLFDAATVPKKLLLVPHAGHNDVASVGDEDYRQAVREFIRSVRAQHQLAEPHPNTAH